MMMKRLLDNVFFNIVPGDDLAFTAKVRPDAHVTATVDMGVEVDDLVSDMKDAIELMRSHPFYGGGASGMGKFKLRDMRHRLPTEHPFGVFDAAMIDWVMRLAQMMDETRPGQFATKVKSDAWMGMESICRSATYADTKVDVEGFIRARSGISGAPGVVDFQYFTPVGVGPGAGGSYYPKAKA